MLRERELTPIRQGVVYLYLGGDLEHLERHRGAEDGALHGLGHVLEHVVDLFLEASASWWEREVR